MPKLWLQFSSSLHPSTPPLPSDMLAAIINTTMAKHSSYLENALYIEESDEELLKSYFGY
ncbi:hypothetical protein HI914_03172 [Erysiphe necator]|nr:hypothetical protein HI914_03172 [Erysiphe necator]